MKVVLKLLLIFFIMTYFSLFLTPQFSYARGGGYTVKGIILIPNDWRSKVTNQEIDQYKNGALNNLNIVQQFYASKLNGNTFDFDPTVDIVYSKADLAGHEDQNPFSLFMTLNSLNREIEMYEPKKVKVIWIIGSQVVAGVYAAANAQGTETGVAAMPYADLLAASSNGSFDQQQFSKETLAHELGHTFGLVFSGYARGHPCTVMKTDECLDNAPQPYPQAIEWASVMGYGTPFLQFPDNNFNNTIFNPEIWKLYQSPFLNPQHNPAPEPAPDLGVKKTYFQYRDNPFIVTAGTSLEMDNKDKFFGETPGKVEFLFPPDLTAKLSEQDYEVTEWSNQKIQILIKPSAESPTTSRKWRMRITSSNNNIFETSNDIEIRGNLFGKPTALLLTADLLTTCGTENKPIPAFANFSGGTGASKVSSSTKTDDITGKGEVSLEIESPQSGNQYSLDPASFPGITENPQSQIITLEQSDIIAGTKVVNINIHYPSCPSTAQPSVSPSSSPLSALLPTPSGKAIKGWYCADSTQMFIKYADGTEAYDCTCGANTNNVEDCRGGTNCVNSSDIPAGYESDAKCVTPSTTEIAPAGNPAITASSNTIASQLLISNYADFRSANAPGDVGSPTITINNPGGHSVVWTLSTLDSQSNKNVYFRQITNDQYSDQSVSLGDGSQTEVAGVKIQANLVKEKVVNMTINEQPVDLNAQNKEVQIRLDGVEGQAKKFSIPYTVEYANGEIVRSAFEIDYQPAISNACQCPYSQACTTTDGREGIQTCNGIWQNGANSTCVYDGSGKCNPSCNANTCIANETTPSPAPGSSANPNDNYCLAAGYFACNVGEPNGSCTSNGQTCTAYNTYQCNFEGQNYCDKSNCADPCNVPTPTPASQCTEVRQYNECTGCNTSRRIKQDSCGNYTVIVDSQPDSNCSSLCATHLTGWFCQGNVMYERFSDNSTKPDCSCGSNVGDCSGGTNATICRSKNPVTPYTEDAECTTPSCPAMTCQYSQAVNTGVCSSGVQVVSGTGCSGSNCAGCTYVGGCSTVSCYNPPPPTNKTIRGWYCADSTHMYIRYSDGSEGFDCTCGDNTQDCGGGNTCVNKNQSDVPAGYDSDAQCINQGGQPPANKTLTGWFCGDSTRMYKKYSDGSEEYDCTCGEDTEDCRSGSTCVNKSDVPPGYQSDAQCIN